MLHTHFEMPSLREWNAVSDALSDIIHCQVVEREHPELHASMRRVLNLLEDLWQDNDSESALELESLLEYLEE